MSLDQVANFINNLKICTLKVLKQFHGRVRLIFEQLEINSRKNNC